MTFCPVTWQELMRMASTGELLQSDLVVHVRMTKSLGTGSVPSLFVPTGQPGSTVETIGTGINVAGVRDRQERSGSR